MPKTKVVTKRRIGHARTWIEENYTKSTSRDTEFFEDSRLDTLDGRFYYDELILLRLEYAQKVAFINWAINNWAVVRLLSGDEDL